MVTALNRYSEFEPRPLRNIFGADLSPNLVAISFCRGPNVREGLTFKSIVKPLLMRRL